jgi:hypothetical protein
LSGAANPTNKTVLLADQEQEQGVRPHDGQERRRFQSSMLLPTPLKTMR